MKLSIFCTLLTIAMVTQLTQASKTKEFHRSRRSVIIKTMHNMWLNRRRRDIDVLQLVSLREQLTRMRRSLVTGPTQVTKVEIKFKSDWLEPMYKNASTQYRLMDANIQDAIFTELFGDAEFIESKVKTLKKSQDKKVIADIEFDFDQSEEDPLGHLRAIVATGRISGMEIYRDYFVILNNNEAAKPLAKPTLPNKPADAAVPTTPANVPTPTAPAVPTTSAVYTGPYQEFQFDIKLKQPWDPRLSDPTDGMTKELDDHIQQIITIIYDKEPNFVDDKVETISNGPDAHPFVRIMLRFKPGENNPEELLMRLVKSGLLGDIPIFDDYLNGQLPGTNVPPPNPQKQMEPRPTKELVPYHPPPKDNASQPPAPAPTPTQAFVQTTQPPPQPQTLDGNFTLDQTWYPFMDNIQSATDKILSDDIAKAIKEAFKPMDVGVEITSLSRSPDGKIQVNYHLTFPPGVTPTQKALEDAMAHGFLGGFPIYTGKKVSDAAIPAPTAAAPVPTASQNWYNNQTSQTSYPIQTSYPAPANQTSYTSQTSYTATTNETSSNSQPDYTAPTSQTGYTAPTNQTNYNSQPDYSGPTSQTGYTGQTSYTAPANQTNYTEQTSQTPVEPAIPPLSSNPTPSNQTSYTGQTSYATPTNQTAANPSPSVPTYNEVPILPVNPPVVKYQPGVIPLPRGIPHSCEEIRSYGIGNEDGEYVIKARDKCHLSIICQNMKEPHPKEYLGGPAQKEWMYYHYAVLVKLSAQDKIAIDKRACLENTATGREFIAKVMAADASQGNPLVPWKTNIKRMVNSFIGRKKRRSMENMDITLCTRPIKIYKRNSRNIH